LKKKAKGLKKKTPDKEELLGAGRGVVDCRFGKKKQKLEQMYEREGSSN